MRSAPGNISPRLERACDDHSLSLPLSFCSSLSHSHSLLSSLSLSLSLSVLLTHKSCCRSCLDSIRSTSHITFSLFFSDNTILILTQTRTQNLFKPITHRHPTLTRDQSSFFELYSSHKRNFIQRFSLSIFYRLQLSLN